MTLIGLALADSVYLTYRHFALADVWANHGADLCSALFGTGCDTALRSPTAVQLGIPLAGWGIIYYVTLATLLILGWALSESFEFEAKLAAVVLSLAGTLVSLALVLTMLIQPSSFCPLCLVVHVINAVLVFPLARMTGRPTAQLLQALLEAGKCIVGANTAFEIQSRWKFVGFITVALVALVVYQWLFVEEMRRGRMGGNSFDPHQVLAAFDSTAVHEIPPDRNDPTLGPSDAPVELVVFSDFQCPACKAFSKQCSSLVKRFDGNLKIIFKHFPLGTLCNPSVGVDIHPWACAAAWAAESARRQGKFWAFHDYLFQEHAYGQDSFDSMATELRLDLQQFRSDRLAEVVKEKIKSDVALGIRLGVDATPAVFLNGRRIFDISEQSLLLLITHSLELARQ